MKKSSISNVVPSFEDFSKLARQFNRVPVSVAYQSDLETPLSAYLKLAKGNNGFLLESVEKNEQVARYSIVGFDPSGVFEAKNGFLNHRRENKRASFAARIRFKSSKERLPPFAKPPWKGRQGFWAGWWGSWAMMRSAISRNCRNKSRTSWTCRTFT